VPPLGDAKLIERGAALLRDIGRIHDDQPEAVARQADGVVVHGGGHGPFARRHVLVEGRVDDAVPQSQ